MYCVVTHMEQLFMFELDYTGFPLGKSIVSKKLTEKQQMKSERLT